VTAVVRVEQARFHRCIGAPAARRSPLASEASQRLFFLNVFCGEWFVGSADERIAGGYAASRSPQCRRSRREDTRTAKTLV
jgi:hypothetical protein